MASEEQWVRSRRERRKSGPTTGRLRRERKQTFQQGWGDVDEDWAWPIAIAIWGSHCGPSSSTREYNNGDKWAGANTWPHSVARHVASTPPNGSHWCMLPPNGTDPFRNVPTMPLKKSRVVQCDVIAGLVVLQFVSPIVRLSYTYIYMYVYSCVHISPIINIATYFPAADAAFRCH